VLQLTADAVGAQWITLRAQYEFADRAGSGLNEDLLAQIGEQPQMRHYDVANRSRHRLGGQVDIIPDDVWIFSATAGIGEDDYDDSYFGLQESTFRVFGVAADFRLQNGFGGGVSYNHERYGGLQQSRSASPGQETDPWRDWTADSTENVHYVSIHAAPPRIGRATEVRLAYDYSFAEGSYLYEPFRVYDFAFDPTVVDGIVQPSSLVMGYVYRPYTAHSAVIGLKYFW
jgi:hypothetical protein